MKHLISYSFLLSVTVNEFQVYQNIISHQNSRTFIMFFDSSSFSFKKLSKFHDSWIFKFFMTMRLQGHFQNTFNFQVSWTLNPVFTIPVNIFLHTMENQMWLYVPLVVHVNCDQCGPTHVCTTSGTCSTICTDMCVSWPNMYRDRHKCVPPVVHVVV